jgi:hypothetical protein
MAFGKASAVQLKRRIKTQTVLPSAETDAMLFWAVLASCQINMRKIDVRKTLAEALDPQANDLPAQNNILVLWRQRYRFPPPSRRSSWSLMP